MQYDYIENKQYIKTFLYKVLSHWIENKMFCVCGSSVICPVPSEFAHLYLCISLINKEKK